jgi:hypothetical protein
MTDQRTESEIFDAYEAERAALANAKAEIARLQEFRPTLLQTATVDEIIEIDDEIRRHTIATEIAAARMKPLKFDLDMATRERAKWAGCAMPSDAELDRLLAIVSAAYPALALEKEQGRFDVAMRDHRAEFKAAFYAVGRMGRLSEPDAGRYFSSVVDDANSILRAHRIKEVEGDALLAAAIAWGDCAWRGADSDMVQPLEVGIARLNQGSPARPVWRDILAGKANLVAPLPPRGMRATSGYPTPVVKVYREGADGAMRETDPTQPTWAQ